VTTGVRTPPHQHGTDDRCYRAGCRRTECRTAYRTARKKAELRAIRGIPDHAPGPRIAAHIQTVIDSGKTRLQIAAESHVSDRAIRYILAGQPEVQWAKAAALLAVQPYAEALRTDATGTRRRIEGMAAAGWPVTHTADQIGVSRRYVFDILNGTTQAVDTALANRVIELCRQRADKTGPSLFTRNRAAANGWAPLAAWDDIDNRREQPDWTGHCGTDRGWRVHRENGQSPCARCDQAHTAWVAEIAELPGSDRARAMAAAKAAAAGRGNAIAEDALWLRDQGYTRHQVADRLGESIDYIDQSVKRYRAALNAAEAEQAAA
jgi:hypothetical protein